MFNLESKSRVKALYIVRERDCIVFLGVPGVLRGFTQLILFIQLISKLRSSESVGSQMHIPIQKNHVQFLIRMVLQ